MSDVEFSGASMAALASDPAYVSRSGEYVQASDGILAAVRSSRVSCDVLRAVKLWDDSKQLVHLAADEEPAQLR